MPRFAANLSLLFTELPFLERFKAAAEAGFSAVEFMSPYEFSSRAIAAALQDNGLTQSCTTCRRATGRAANAASPASPTALRNSATA